MPLLFNPLKYVERLHFHLVVSKICCMKDERGVMGTWTEHASPVSSLTGAASGLHFIPISIDCKPEPCMRILFTAQEDL